MSGPPSWAMPSALAVAWAWTSWVMPSRFTKVIFMPVAYLTLSVDTPLKAVVFGDAALPMATPLAMVMSSSAGMVRPRLAEALMVPEVALMATGAEVVGVADPARP